MTTQNRIKTVLTLVAVAMAVLAGSAQALECQLGILTPETLAANNPATGAPWQVGDQYRIAFITSTNPGCTLSTIEEYNALIQDLADAAGLGAATWKVIGSTSLVDARDNTSTNPTVETGHAIFLVDGSTVVANDYADLWDHSVDHIINLDENGVTKVHWPFTGSYWDGTLSTGHPVTGGGGLDNLTGEVTQGNGGSTSDWVWRTWTSDPHATANPLYGMSDPLFIVGEIDPNLPDVDAGPDMITWSGQAVILDANVVNNDTTEPQGTLIYAWTAEPNGIGDPNLDVVITGADQEDASVTITKTAPTGDVTVVKMTLAVTLPGKDPVKDSMTIDVYDDACVAAIALGMEAFDVTDLDQNCITNFKDFAVMAATWLDDYALTGPVVK